MFTKLTNKLWTKAEEELLSSIFPLKGIKASAAALNRTESSVAKKASRLGLHSKAMFLTHEQYENKLFEKEIDIWPKEQYINTRTPILHECVNGHKWNARPHDILTVQNGCPECATTGFRRHLPGTLYYIRITKDNLTYYKVGITNHSIAKRFSKEKYDELKILFEERFEVGEEALTWETAILREFKQQRVHIDGFLTTNGNTELFEYDILGMDS